MTFCLDESWELHHDYSSSRNLCILKNVQDIIFVILTKAGLENNKNRSKKMIRKYMIVNKLALRSAYDRIFRNMNIQ